MVSSDPGIAPYLSDWSAIWQETLSWQPSFHETQQFQILYQSILDGNRQLNLTRITAPIDFLEKHLWDSLWGIQPFLTTATPAFATIDIGTGAGFPGVPIAIVQPNWTVTLLDSTRKKITFLDQLLKTLNLFNSKTLVGRAEEIGQNPTVREHYDLAVVRAVADASVCAEYALPLLKVNGLAILYRGRWTDAEASALTTAATVLGGAIEQVTACKTPITHSDRHCVYIRKISPTPIQYPRTTGIPEQKPLGHC